VKYNPTDFPDVTPSKDYYIEDLGMMYSESIEKGFNPQPKDLPTVEIAKDRIGMFAVKSANQWIKEAALLANPTALFDEFWFEFELCFLYADTNQGKSILAVQIGNEIARRLMVIYLDLELSAKQFQGRYSDDDYENPFHFQDNFIRIEIDTNAEIPDTTFEEYLVQSLEAVIISTGVKVIIIDNVTYLSAETEKAKDALPLMKELKKLKSKHGLSILLLAHTPKRDLSKPITRNDLQGSKMLINFCDSAFAIGESMQGSDVKYLKQIKVRQTQFKYDAENVKVCRIVKPDNFLHFEFTGYSSEADHLKVRNQAEKEAIKEQAIALRIAGKSIRQIAHETGLSATTVYTYTKDCVPGGAVVFDDVPSVPSVHTPQKKNNEQGVF
jgi:hypothetical protein